MAAVEGALSDMKPASATNLGCLYTPAVELVLLHNTVAKYQPLTSRKISRHATDIFVEISVDGLRMLFFSDCK